MLNKVATVLKPPYSAHDIPALIGVLLILLLIPFITLNLSNIGSQKTRAAAIPCPSLGNFGDVDGINGVTSADALMVNQIVARLKSPTPEQKKNADVDGDGAVTSLDAQVILLYEGGSALQTTFRACADNDGDGFSNVLENYLGTKPYSICGTDAWPPDFNNDKLVDVSDILYLKSVFGTKIGNSSYKPRYDLVADGIIDSNDILSLKPYFGGSCQPIRLPAITMLDFYGNGSTSPTVTAGAPLVLTWSSVQLTKPCLGEDGWPSAVVNVNGTYTYSAMSLSDNGKKYTLLCGNMVQQWRSSVTVKVNSPCPSILPANQLYKTSTSPTVYVVNSSCQKQPVASPDAMAWCRYDWSKVNDPNIASVSNIDKYLPFVADGSLINVNSNCPTAPTVVCGGNLVYSMNNQKDGYVNINTGDSVSSSGSGLSGCSSNDKLYLQYWNWDSPDSTKWKSLGLSCDLGSSGTCSKSWVPSEKLAKDRGWPIRMTLNQSGDGDGSASSGWVFVNITQAAPPPSAVCTGSPILSLSQTTVTSGSGTTITVRSSGFANCGSGTTQFFWIRPVTRSYWQYSDNFGQCNFGSNPNECSASLSQPNDVGRYYVAVTVDLPNGITKEDLEYLDVIAPPPPTPSPTPTGGSQDQIKNFIRDYVGGNVVEVYISGDGGSYYQKVNIGQFLWSIAYCESGWNPSAVNPHSGATGLFQYIPSTWQSTAIVRLGGSLGTDIWNYQDQTRVTNWKVRADGGSNVNAWTSFTNGCWKNNLALW